MAIPEPEMPKEPSALSEVGGQSLRQWLLEVRVLRGMAIAAALGLLVLAPVSTLPWLATGLSALLFALIFYGWRLPTVYGLRSSASARHVLAQQVMQLNAILDAIASPTILIDHRGNVVHANARALITFSGLRHGHPFSFSVRAPSVIAALQRVMGTDIEARTEFSERVPMERSFDVLIRRLGKAKDSLALENGVPFALVFMTETTTARRLEAMRVDFVANASHELRTPLASILGFIETLQGSARNDERARLNFLGIMEAQARRMSRLIDDLLSLSKIELTAHIPPSEAVDIGLLLPAVLDALSGMARERNVKLNLVMPEPATSEAVDLRVIGDRDELVRVFENLIENAMKYGQSGGKVDIVAERIEDAALGPALAVAVRDYGPGVAEAHLPRLTERFYRVDAGESRILGGTGLGLAIVKHIMTRHRGRLLIASRPGEGATFTVLLARVTTARNS
jgi:two-component system, OmpR family, phosphate regulon sensor histidine kinase PhoR